MICDRKLTAKLVNIGGSFPFYTNYKYYLESSISSQIFGASISSEIIYFASTTKDLINIY